MDAQTRRLALLWASVILLVAGFVVFLEEWRVGGVALIGVGAVCLSLGRWPA